MSAATSAVVATRAPGTAPSLLRRAGARVRSFVARALHQSPPPVLDAPGHDFVEFCRHRWPEPPADGAPLLLMHQTEWFPLILAYTFLTRALARRQGQALASFGFGRSGRPLDELFAGFGAASLLGPRELRRHAAPARKLAAEIFRGLRTKRDVPNICVDGLSLGDLIYDSYLRFHCRGTVDLADLRLRAVIEQTLERFFASRELFEKRTVAAVIVDHAVYIDSGVLARLALQRGLPVYHLPCSPAALLPLDRPLFPHFAEGPGSAPAGLRSCKLPLPFHLFRKIFAAVPAADQPALRKLGREKLAERLTGSFDTRVLAGGSAYTAGSGARILAETGRPRVVIMLHDFCDAPHAYRDLLFADHYDWACWLLERAAHTPFDWYAKPHPNSAHDQTKARLNDGIIAELKARFPHIRFLPPGTSNRQLIDEGLAAVFTGYGTVGHEFAFVGVPVVNAGDNPHVNYGFNFHPQTVAELAALVDAAGDLELRIDAEEVAEYSYLRNVHFFDRTFHTVDFVPPELAASPEGFRKTRSSEVLRLVADDPAARESAIEEYLDRLYASGRHRLPA